MWIVELNIAGRTLRWRTPNRRDLLRPGAVRALTARPTTA